MIIAGGYPSLEKLAEFAKATGAAFDPAKFDDIVRVALDYERANAEVTGWARVSPTGKTIEIGRGKPTKGILRLVSSGGDVLHLLYSAPRGPMMDISKRDIELRRLWNDVETAAFAEARAYWDSRKSERSRIDRAVASAVEARVVKWRAVARRAADAWDANENKRLGKILIAMAHRSAGIVSGKEYAELHEEELGQ